MVYVFLADGFEEIEALAPVDIMRRAGLSVKTVGVGGTVVTGSHGIPVTADVTAGEVTMADAQAIVLPGGMPGTHNLEACSAVQAAIDYAAAHDCWIAAICAAPSILGHRDLLRGRRATCFPGFEKDLYGATATGEPVVTDGRFVTARGAGVAVEFGLRLVRELCSPQQEQALREGMQCR